MPEEKLFRKIYLTLELMEISILKLKLQLEHVQFLCKEKTELSAQIWQQLVNILQSI